MMKQFKKFTLITTAAFLFCITATTETISSISFSSITIEAEENAEPTPLPEEPEINPLADENEGDNRVKK